MYGKSVIYYDHCVVFELVDSVRDDAVLICKVEIFHLGCEIYAFRLLVQTQLNERIVDRDDVLDDLYLPTAANGRSVQKVVYESVLFLLIHERHNALCGKIRHYGLLVAYEKIDRADHDLF